MRLMIALLLVPFAMPSLAGDWSTYRNARFGYEVAVPPDFVGQGEADNGDGQVFRSSDGRAILTVWGGYLRGPDLGAEMTARKAGDIAEGWSISYSADAPDWGSYSGTQGGHIVHVRSVATCGGAASANFRLRYPEADAVRLRGVVDRLVLSLRGGACG